MWDCRGGSVGADIAGEGKPFQGQHGNVTFGLLVTAMSCVGAARWAGETQAKERDQGRK